MTACRNCGSTTDTYPVQRKGAGTYNRAPRWYWSTLCGRCATDMRPYADGQGVIGGAWSKRDVRRIADGVQP